jgi:CRISPR type IV-associated protein Csf2
MAPSKKSVTKSEPVPPPITTRPLRHVERHRYEVILVAESAIAHHSGSNGNEAIFNREASRIGDEIIDLPVISAASMRNRFFAAGMNLMLDASGLLDGAAFSVPVLQTLFSDCGLDGSSSASKLRVEQYRELVDKLPLLSLKGGSMGRSLLPGSVQVEPARLICDEESATLPDWVNEWLASENRAVDVAGQYLSVAQKTRRDPSRDPRNHRLLSDAALAEVEGAQDKAGSDDDRERREAKSSSMIMRHETVVRGALFFWRIEAQTQTEAQKDAFLAALWAFLNDARVGGKANDGHGRLRALVVNRIPVLRPREAVERIDARQVGADAAERFRERSAQSAAEIAAFLTGAVS